MAVKIRLRRTGKRNAPAHRIVVADGRSPRDGRFIEIIGTYDPRKKTEAVDLERADYWISQGAQPSETVAAIIKRAKAGVPMAPEAAVEEAAAVTSEETPEPETTAETAEETNQDESVSEPATTVESSGDESDQDEKKEPDA